MPVHSGPVNRRRTVDLDEFDRKILTLLQQDNRMAQRDVAGAVNLSSSSVNRRIAAMEAAEIIRANVAVVDPAKVGRPITVIAEITVESERLDLLDAVKRRFVDCPQVQQVYYVTGEVDFVLVMTESPTWPNTAAELHANCSFRRQCPPDSARWSPWSAARCHFVLSMAQESG